MVNNILGLASCGEYSAWTIYYYYYYYFASIRDVFLFLHGHLTIIHARQERQGRSEHPGFSSLLWQAVMLFLSADTFHPWKSIFFDRHDCQKWTHMNEPYVVWEPHILAENTGHRHPLPCLLFSLTSGHTAWLTNYGMLFWIQGSNSKFKL